MGEHSASGAGEPISECDRIRALALGDLADRLRFSTIVELDATVDAVDTLGASVRPLVPGAAALLDLFADVVRTEAAAHDRELDDALSRLLGPAAG